MDVKSRMSGEIAVLELNGRFDAYVAPSVVDWFDRTITDAPRIVADLSGVSFVDSTALATLVQGMKRCRQHAGDLHLSGLQQPVRIILELTRLDKAFSIFGREDEAVAAFGH